MTKQTVAAREAVQADSFTYAYGYNSPTARTLMSKPTNVTFSGQCASSSGNTSNSNGNSQFDDSSSVSSYSNSNSCSFENESMSMSMMSSGGNDKDSVMKAAMVLTARRSYPRRSAPTIATGRRNLKSEAVPREEAERRRVRRERNKMAATRCRQKRNEITTLLQRTVEQLEAEKRRDEEQLRALETMRNHLQFVLSAHESVCEQRASSSSHLISNQQTMVAHAPPAHAHPYGHGHGQHGNHADQLVQPCGIAFGNAMQNTHGRPQSLLFGHATTSAAAGISGLVNVNGGSTAITPATDLLAFADMSGLPPLVNLNGAANRCFGQQVVIGSAN